MSDENDENWRERRLQQQQSAAAGAAAASYELALTGLAVCGTAPRSSAAVYRRRLPARATTVYNNTKATELTQAGNGGVRRAAVSGGGQLMKRPLTGRNHHIHILLAVSQSKMT